MAMVFNREKALEYIRECVITGYDTEYGRVVGRTMGGNVYEHNYGGIECAIDDGMFEADGENGYPLLKKTLVDIALYHNRAEYFYMDCGNIYYIDNEYNMYDYIVYLFENEHDDTLARRFNIDSFEEFYIEEKKWMTPHQFEMFIKGKEELAKEMLIECSDLYCELDDASIGKMIRTSNVSEDKMNQFIKHIRDIKRIYDVYDVDVKGYAHLQEVGGRVRCEWNDFSYDDCYETSMKYLYEAICDAEEQDKFFVGTDYEDMIWLGFN